MTIAWADLSLPKQNSRGIEKRASILLLVEKTHVCVYSARWELDASIASMWG
jgi:hypothetical protein